MKKLNDTEIEEIVSTHWILVPPGFHGAKKFSPSRLTIALSDFVVLMWLIILSNYFIPKNKSFEFSVVIVTITLAYMILIIISTRSTVCKRHVPFRWKRDLNKKTKYTIRFLERSLQIWPSFPLSVH